MNGLKLRVIIGTLERGGTEIHLSQILPSLAEKGWLVELVVLSKKLALIKNFTHPNIKIHHPHFSFDSLSAFNKYCRLIYTVYFLYKILSKNSDMITHFFLPRAYIMGIILSKLTRYRGPLLMSRRSLNHYQKRRPILKIETKFHKYCQFILSNSKAVQKQLIEEESVSIEKTILIYNGVEEKRFLIGDKNSYRKELGFSSDQFIIVCVANLIPYKGHIDLIRGLSQIKNDLPYNWKALLIGRDSGIKSDLEIDIKKYNLEENILLIENCDEPAPFLLSADLGILASHEEGFSNAIIEMMAAGLPIIATNVGGNPEAIAHEKNGLLIRPCCPEDIAYSILRLSKDVKLRQQFGEENYQTFSKNYTIGKCVETYEEVYKKCYGL